MHTFYICKYFFSISVRSYTKETHNSYEPRNELTDIFIGGPKNLLQSQSKSSFKGCMQDIIISQVCI